MEPAPRLLLKFLLADKPAGAPTHATERGPGAPEGCVEHFARVSNQSLFVCHRLDKGTTGAIVFASNAEDAGRLSELFAGREIKKRYLFLTDRSLHGGDRFTVESRIEKRGGKFVSDPGEANSHTEFEKLRTEGKFSLWEARPHTGKPHQIRLHASDKGIPILGDSEHGGSGFPALCLHSQEVSFVWETQTVSHKSQPPIFFEKMDLLSRPGLCSWLSAVDRRMRWLRSRERALNLAGQADSPLLQNETWRWIHTEGGKLRAEQLGSLVSLQWFSDAPPNDSEWKDIRELATLCGWRDWRLHLRLDRGKNPNTESVWESRPDLPARWTARENGLTFSFRSDSGLSAGLFLDQRANRHWTRETTKRKRVLNLFAYTGGFSVAAAAGGAEKTVSVDLSRGFLDWAQENMKFNDIDPANHEFRAMDAREYLKYALRKELRFDLVICDPPSFGRSDKGVFRLEKEIEPLLENISRLLNPNGEIFFSCNFEGWTDEQFQKEIKTIATKLRLDPQSMPPSDWDFEMPRVPRIMKAALLKRRS